MIKHTYANITYAAKQKPKRVPKIIIKIFDKDDQTYIKEKITHYIIEDKYIQIKQVYKKNNEEMVVNSMNENSISATDTILKNKLVQK